MNYLVHLYLSGPDPLHQLGGLMGDFVKGRIPDTYPPEIIAGLQLHRRIDSFAQTNEYTRRSRQRLNERFGHGRGIIVDIFYDHFLAVHWQDFSKTPLADYAASVYNVLQLNNDMLPIEMKRVSKLMKEHNWLTAYQHQHIVERALKRTAERLSRPIPLEESITDLEQHRKQFREDFIGFLAESKTLARSQLDW